jgi:hypothetical protein
MSESIVKIHNGSAGVSPIMMPLSNLPTWIATNYDYRGVIIICRNPDVEMCVLNNEMSPADKERMLCSAIYMNQLDDLEYDEEVEDGE